MRKQEFLAELRTGLSGLPQNDIEERLTFYGEMIDDRVEEGLTEEDAVSDIGTVDEVVSQTVAEIPLTRLVKERARSKRTPHAREIALLILGSPLWLSLLIAALAVILAAYIVVWSVIVSLWAADVSLAAGTLESAISAVLFAVRGNALTAIAMLGAGIFCAGLSIFLFFGCKEVTKGTLLLTRKTAWGMKSLLIGKEEAR